MDELLAQEMNRRRLLKMAGSAQRPPASRSVRRPPRLDRAPATSRCGGGASRRPSASRPGWTTRSRSSRPQTGSSVSPTLMDTAQVIPQFTKAAAAGNVPDVQFLFNGIYHMENVWLGYLKPLNGLVSPRTIKQGGGTTLSQLPGQAVPHGLLRARRSASQYNKEHFDKAGLNADSPPKTWDAFIDACDKLKSKGYIPLGGGVKDGFLGEWWLVNALTQNLNSAGRRAQPVHRQARLARAEVPRALDQAAGAPRRTATATTTSTRSTSTRASSSSTPARRRWRSTTRRRCPTRRRSSARTTSAS